MTAASAAPKAESDGDYVLCRFDLNQDADIPDYIAKTMAVVPTVRAENGCQMYALLKDAETDWDKPQRFGEHYGQKERYAEFGHYLPYIKDDDFLGVQNYTRSRFGFFGQIDPPKDAELTQMSYEFYPEALSNVIRAVHKEFKGDLIVTENGIATTDDSRRVEFIRRALEGVQSCIEDGIPVKGYCHWSLLDNFEWQKGFSMTFGLIAVDRKSQTRFPKESLTFLGRCFSNQ